MLEDQIMREGCQIDDGPYCMIRNRNEAIPDAHPYFNLTNEDYLIEETNEDQVTNVMGDM